MAGAGNAIPEAIRPSRGRVSPLVGQSACALENAKTALGAAGATARDVVQWTVLFVEGVDLTAAYGAIGPELASDEPAVVTGGRVAALGVPGARVEISAVAAVFQ